MINHRTRLAFGQRRIACLFGLVVTATILPLCQADPTPELSDIAPPAVLTLESAVAWALKHNPDLAALRQLHGVSAAGIVIAQTYPYNPTFYERTTYAQGVPPDVTNHIPVQSGLFFQIELCGQGRYRDQAASANLSRTDWEIAFQEVALAVRVARSFQTVVYRQGKLQLAEDTVRLNQKVADQVRQLVDQGRLRGGDNILARTEVNANQAQVYPARTILLAAMADLYRGLGVTCPLTTVQGTLDTPISAIDCQKLLEQALELRADRHARQIAVAEAEARVRLQVADRFGNPTIGPFYERDQTKVDYYGVQMNIPVPIFNQRNGEIQQRQAEKQRALLDLSSNEVLIQQDVAAATARLASAREGAQNYQTNVLPNLRSGLEGLQKLFQQGDPSADVFRVIDMQRKLLLAQSSYLDILWEVSQAQADLAAAVGDPALAVPSSHIPEQLPPPK